MGEPKAANIEIEIHETTMHFLAAPMMAVRESCHSREVIMW